MTDETRQQITAHIAAGDTAESCPICYQWLRAMLAKVEALEAERDALKAEMERRELASFHITRTVEQIAGLIADRDRLAVLVREVARLVPVSRGTTSDLQVCVYIKPEMWAAIQREGL